MKIKLSLALQAWLDAGGAQAQSYLVSLLKQLKPEKLLASLSYQFVGKRSSHVPFIASFSRVDHGVQVFADGTLLTNKQYQACDGESMVYCLRLQSDHEQPELLNVKIVVAKKSLLLSPNEFDYDSPTVRGRGNTLVMEVTLDFRRGSIEFTNRGVAYCLRRQGYMTELSIRLLKQLQPMLGDCQVSNNLAADIATMLFFTTEPAARVALKTAYQKLKPLCQVEDEYNRILGEVEGDYDKVPTALSARFEKLRHKYADIERIFSEKYRHAYTAKLSALVSFHEGRKSRIKQRPVAALYSAGKRKRGAHCVDGGAVAAVLVATDSAQQSKNR